MAGMAKKQLAAIGKLLWSLHPLSVVTDIPKYRNMVSGKDRATEAKTKTTVEV